MPDVQQTKYNVIKYENEMGGELDAETVNLEPLSLYDAVTLAVDVVNNVFIHYGYRMDGITPTTTADIKQHWNLCHAQYPSRKAVVDVVEVTQS